MSVELPRRLGPFLLLRHLAAGGMGDVYLAHQSLGVVERLCVVKTVRAELSESQAAMRRFLDEAKTTALLAHKNIAAVLDVGESDGTAFIAVEHVAGRDLHAVFQQSRRLKKAVPEDVALYAIGELLDALAYVHRAAHPRTGEPLNVVHRDVSPHNVMVSFEGEVKLIDFGVARSALKSDVTQTGQAVGKIRYMSPEQARADKDITGASDVFAVCVVATELLTGRRFYGDLNMEQLWMRIAGGVPHEPQGFARLPADLQRVLRRGLEADPAARPTASELKEMLVASQVRRGTLGSSDGLREHLALLFEGEQEEERKTHALLLQEPTSMHAAHLPSATVFEDTPADANDLLDAFEPDAPTSSRLDTQAMLPSRARLTAETVAAPAPSPPPDPPDPLEVRSFVPPLERTPRTGALSAPVTNTGLKRRKKRRVNLAVLAGVALPLTLGMVVAAVVLHWGEPEVEPPPLAPIARPPVDVAPVDVAPVEAAPVDVAPVEVAPVDVAPVEVAPVEEPREVESVRRRPKRVDKRPEKPKRPRLLGDRLQALKVCAPKPPCAAPVLARAKDILALSADDVKALDEDVSWCLAQCR